METGEKAFDFLAGEKLYQQRAREVLPILVRQAKAMKTIYYSDLATEVGMPNPRNLNYPLGSIGNALKSLSEKWGAAIPQIQCIVVNRGNELPGEGVGWFIDKDDFKKLNNRQKREIVNRVVRDVIAFSRWDEVLLALGLKSFEKTPAIEEIVLKAKAFGGSGESEQHKALKDTIARNPNLLGINIAGYKAEIEYALPSADSIDVLFQGTKEWVGVEVKSEVSGVEDILRGLFQCVKYHALLEATLSVLGESKDVRVFLALGSGFPPVLIPAKNVLGISVIDNITTNDIRVPLLRNDTSLS